MVSEVARDALESAIKEHFRTRVGPGESASLPDWYTITGRDAHTCCSEGRDVNMRCSEGQLPLLWVPTTRCPASIWEEPSY